MAFTSLGTLDGGNSAQSAKRLGTFNRATSRSFGGVFSSNEQVEWFQFRTDGSRFNRSSVLFAAAGQNTKTTVFFNSDLGQGSRKLGQLTISGDARTFKTKTRGNGTYLIRIVPLFGSSPAYGIAFEVSGSGRQTSAAPASTDRDPRSLFS